MNLTIDSNNLAMNYKAHNREKCTELNEHSDSEV